MKLLLISGHGAGDPGAVSEIGGKSYREADEARRVTAALSEALRSYCAADVYPTDRNAYEDYRKGTLSAVAQFSRYDYVLEVHFNALSLSLADGVTKGVECYVPAGQSDTRLASSLCAGIAAQGLKNRGVKKKNWSVIYTAHRAGVPAALLEVCFIDDADDMAVYTRKFNDIIQAMADAISTAYGLRKDETMTGKEIYDALNEYTKTLEIPAWAKEEFDKAVAAGITDGTNPMQMIPRYQAAIMSLRAKKG